MLIRRSLVARGVKTPPLVFQSALSYATTVQRYQDSFNKLNRLNHKDWLAPNEILKIITPLKDPDTLISVLDRISQRKDYKPNEALFTLIIDKLAKANKFDAVDDVLKRIKMEKGCRLSDDFFYGVIKNYGNVGGRVDRAIETLFDMPSFNCWPTVKTFNFVLNLLVSAKKFGSIHDVYMGAAKLGIKIDACCLNILIKGLCESGNLDAALYVLDEFPKQGCRPTVRTFSTIIHWLCEKGKLDEAFELFEKMEREGIEPDAITFNILISGLRKQGKVEQSIKLLDQMKLKGCHPNTGSYQEVLYGLLDAKRFVDAKQFMDRMLKEGLRPSFLAYKLLIHGLSGENLMRDVDLVLKQMVQQGFVPKMGMWKRMLRRTFSKSSSYNCDIIETIDYITKKF